MKKTGRPTVYQPKYALIAHHFCLFGATNENLAQAFGVATSTIDRWIREKSDFSGALKAGREIADAKVAHSLFQRAIGYSHKSVKLQLHRDGTWKEKEFIQHYPPDPTSAIFWLKNRRPDKWREKLDVQQSVIRVRVEGEEKSENEFILRKTNFLETENLEVFFYHVSVLHNRNLSCVKMVKAG